jgi:DNA-binding response OmpR family regulator
VPRVLVVVRDHGIRDAVAAALADERYEVVTTEHGADALARITRWRPAVILLDMRLPTTDAGASLRRYRQAAGPGVPIVGLAAFPVRDVAAQAAQIGADAALAAPFDPAELRALVHRHASQTEPPTGQTIEQPAAEPIGEPTGTPAGTSRGQAAVVEALRAFAAHAGRHTPWMPAAELARRVGAAGVHDPQFEADVQALYAAGTIRLISGGDAGGRSFYEAMLVPPA